MGKGFEIEYTKCYAQALNQPLLRILENLKKELVDNWSLLNVNHLGDDSSFDLANPYHVPKWKHKKLENYFVSFGQQKLKASWQVNYLDKLVLNVRMGTDVPPK